MESRVRHDLRHPIATISMIASTIAAFGSTLDQEAVLRFSDQVFSELGDLEALLKQHDVVMEIDGLRRAAEQFRSDPASKDHCEFLESECQVLLDLLRAL